VKLKNLGGKVKVSTRALIEVDIVQNIGNIEKRRAIVKMK
jgi:hypothetical protein